MKACPPGPEPPPGNPPPGPICVPPPGWLPAPGWPPAPGPRPDPWLPEVAEVAGEPEENRSASAIAAPATTASTTTTARVTGLKRRLAGPSPGRPAGMDGAGRVPSFAPSSFSSGHRSSGQSPLPGPAGPEDCCDIGCFPPPMLAERAQQD